MHFVATEQYTLCMDYSVFTTHRNNYRNYLGVLRL